MLLFYPQGFPVASSLTLRISNLGGYVNSLLIILAFLSLTSDHYHTESLVNSHIDPEQPDILVVHRVAPELALRLGNQAVGVFNDAYDAEGLPPVDGTTVPGVARRLRSAPPRQGDS